MIINILFAVLVLVLVGADQLIKIFVHSNIPLGEVVYSIPHLADITYVRNEGAAFSMMSGRVSLLSIISVAFCIGVIVYVIVKKPSHTMFKLSLSLMWAGAAGNAIDRIARGYVIDYISLNFMSFPVFNLADTAICTGAVLMVLYVIIFEKD